MCNLVSLAWCAEGHFWNYVINGLLDGPEGNGHAPLKHV